MEPFDITISGTVYSVFPEEDEMFTIFKEGKEYLLIQKDNETNWLKLDHLTELPSFEEDAEVNQIGQLISGHKEENID